MNKKKQIEQWISFTLGTETYVHAVELVREVIHYTPPVPIPGSPPEVEGVLNVRGEVVSVVSGRRLLNLGEQDESADDSNRRVIILETHSGLIGLDLDVDTIKEILTFPEQDIEANMPITDDELTLGTYHHSQGLMIPIDLTGYSNNTQTCMASNINSNRKIIENG